VPDIPHEAGIEASVARINAPIATKPGLAGWWNGLNLRQMAI
jgi:hypothetical protein